MKKILSIILSLFIVLFMTGCTKSATKEVENYLGLYKSLDVSVLKDMNNIIENENLSLDNQKKYEDIFKKQYTDMTYKIINEEYDGDEATIKVKVTVHDLYKVQKDASIYLANHANEFNDDDGKYSTDKYISYKLEQMKSVTDTIDYTIDFYLLKNDNKWTISQLSNTDVEKIHGIYNYES